MNDDYDDLQLLAHHLDDLHTLLWRARDLARDALDLTPADWSATRAALNRTLSECRSLSEDVVTELEHAERYTDDVSGEGGAG